MKKTIKLLIIIAGSMGVSLTLFSTGLNFKGLLYYTVLSNIWAVFSASAFIILDEKKEIDNFWHTLRFLLASGIALTFVVFTTTLLPELIKNGNYGYIFSPSNFLTHFITPILLIIDYIFYGKQVEIKKVYLTLVIPLIYFVITMLLNPVLGITYADNQIVPYFFLNYQTNGWFNLSGGFFRIGVFYWIIIVLIIILLISFGLFGLRKLNKNELYEEVRVNENNPDS